MHDTPPRMTHDALLITIAGSGKGVVSADGFGCDAHPSVEPHRKTAVALRATLKSELGW